MKNTKVYTILILHGLFWCYDCVVDYSIAEENKTLYMVIAFNAFISIAFYFNYLILVPRYLKTFQTINVLKWAFLYLLSYGVIRTLQINIFTYIYVQEDQPLFWFNYNLYLNIVRTAIFYGAMSTGSRLLWEWLNNVKDNKKLQLQKTENQLHFLKNSLNIPFVINVLDELEQKSAVAPADIQDDIIELANIIRYSLYHIKENKIAIALELEYANQLIDLISRLFGHQITCTVNATEQIEPNTIVKSVLDTYWHHQKSFQINIEQGHISIITK